MSETNEIKIIYSDPSLLICVKPAGVPCETADEKTKSLSALLSSQLGAPYIGMVHRLDQVDRNPRPGNGHGHHRAVPRLSAYDFC